MENVEAAFQKIYERGLVDGQRGYVNRKYLAENVFHCDEKTMGRILKMKGFPTIILPGMNPRYSLQEVDKFMRNYQI